MRYIQISEPIFRDLIGCKSKLEDIKLFLSGSLAGVTKTRVVDKVTNIAYSHRYEDTQEGKDESQL